MISIIGAGPVGCYVAKLLAKKGKEVRIFEEHNSIGKPVQCTGIVTKSISEVIRLRNKFVVNRLRKVIVHAPNGKHAEIKTKDIVIDRTGFDKSIAEQARKSGARIILNSRVTGIKRERNRKIKLRVADKRKKKVNVFDTDVLVGADGPKSLVSRFIGNPKPDFWVGVQAVARMPVDKEAYSVYFDRNIPGFFGWVVPENESRARIGIATMKSPKKVFDRFMKRFGKCRVLEMQGGLIPKYDPWMKIHKDEVYIAGDAATQVKATTGGGLVPGLRAAECLSNAICGNKDYRKELRSVERELQTSLMLRNILDRFDEKDYNRLVGLVGNEKIKKILNKDDRDRPSRIVFKSVIKEPKLLLFARTLFRAKRL